MIRLRQVASGYFDKHRTYGTGVGVQERTRCYIYTLYLELSVWPYYRLLGRFLHHYHHHHHHNQRVPFATRIYRTVQFIHISQLHRQLLRNMSQKYAVLSELVNRFAPYMQCNPTFPSCYQSAVCP